MLRPDVYNRSVFFILRVLASVGILFFLSPYRADGQAGQSVEFTPQLGFVVPHRAELRNLVTGHSRGFHAGWQMSSRFASKPKDWHAVYHYPTWGFQVYYADLGNRKQLGQQVALNAVIKIPQFAKYWNGSRRLQLYSQWGIGGGYNSVVWDLEDNPKGIALSSALNICLTAGYLAQVRVSDRFSVSAELNMVHFSNGSLSVPNLGTNNLSAGVGLIYSLAPADQGLPQSNSMQDSLQSDFKKFSWLVSFSSGLRENMPPDGPAYFVHNFAFGFEYRPAFKNGLIVRHDAGYNLSLDPLLLRNGYDEVRVTDRIQLGVAAGLVRYFGRASFEAVLGVYYRNQYAGNGTFYNRFALRHQVTQGISVSLGLKTHWAKADYPELGVLYHF